MDVLHDTWRYLHEYYMFVYSKGLTGAGLSILCGILLSNRGLRMTGRPESFSGYVSGPGPFTLHHNPEIVGTSRTLIGRLVGRLLGLCGAVAFVVGLLAGYNLTF